MRNVLQVLRERGMVEDVTHPEVERALDRPVTVYAGFDPTAESLQVGNLVTVMALAHFQRQGHRVLALVGGATGMIGDPSGKTRERAFLDRDRIARNLAGIRENLARCLDFEHPTAPAQIVNNDDWLGRFGFIDFLRDVGKHFRMGAMLGRESVKARLNSEAGMSFTEFCYQVLQAYDFLHLSDALGCSVQIGGSDQWGNITAGVELIRRLRGRDAYGITMPLVCDATGRKFGKSEGNAVYLDAAKTSPYAFYQFFLRASDEDAVRLLKIFTFLDMDVVAELERGIAAAPERREAQRMLAEEATRSVHGDAGLAMARRASEALFGGPLEGLSAADLESLLADVPSAALPAGAVIGAAVVDVAAAAGMCRSKGEARRLIESGGFYLGARRVTAVDATVGPGDVVDGRIVVLRSGKKRFHLVTVMT